MLIRMSKKAKFSLRERFSKKWESIREHHLTILTTVFVVSIGMMLITLVFIFNGTYNELSPEKNALAWLSGIFGLIIAILLWPEFFYLRGRYNFLTEFMKINSPSELRKDLAEAQESAEILGDRYYSKLQEFLLGKDIKIKKRKSK
tara:strand:- start:2684 stop:3121 length:438 start_codon:yes stop_codon:yes gene_type:complete